MELYHGSPASMEGREEREIRVYELLDRLGVEFDRTDHPDRPATTMEVCADVDRVLDVRICKNLFLCNRQKTNFYLVIMPGDKPFKTKELSKQMGISRLSFAEERYMEELLDGREIEPLIYEDRYGWLMTVYKPIYDSNGTCQCYACVDVSMDKLYGNGTIFLAKLFSLFFGLFVLILAVGLWLTKYHIIFPVNTISYQVSHFAHDNAQAMEEQVKKIHQMAIGTGDEVENLYHAVSKLADDDLQYSLDVQRKNEVIMQMQSGLIIILADLVESRDKCTGDHVRKTAAYVKIIMRQMKILDIYADQLTDEFVKNVGDSAPLHDVGKIHVPDAILNKAGRLTDEEFTIMKEHTTAGAEILDRAIELVPDTGYLREAKNLALYHHEKWNGSGYPMGLSGEDIPLSARIMAVADVFDALVSKRSYKEGMPFEKAMSIIREGSGSHFDAEIVRAFESASEEVQEVSQMIMDMSAGGLII